MKAKKNLKKFVQENKPTDPACGSGVMFLATASVLPAWISQMGLIFTVGQGEGGATKDRAITISIRGVTPSDVLLICFHNDKTQ